jgi:cytochrome c-type biogenesis protein CcmH
VFGGCETRALTDHTLTSILYFAAILSGAGLAFAWLTAAPPLLARFAAWRAPFVDSPSLRRLKAALSSRPAIVSLLLLPFAGVGVALYLHGAVGPGEPPNALLDRARKEAPHDLGAAVAQLEERLAKDPNDADGWRLLSRSYGLLGETEKAAAAAQRAAALGGKDDADGSASAEDLVTANQGKVVPDARRLFQAALAKNPADPRARFFLGLAEAQDGHADAALASWLALEADSPPDAPWLQGLRANIDRLATSAGIGADELARRRAALAKAAPGRIAAPGPSESDVAAAASMSPQDRGSMIRGMVQRLADRLEHEPGDVDGWLRLGRAYAVLGEQQKSLDAYRHASEADPKREDARTAYATARAALGDTK